MKRLTVNKIIGFVVLFLIFTIIAYTYVVFCLASGNTRDFFSELLLSLINGLFLAVVVFIFGFFLERKWRGESKVEVQNEKLISLTNLLKNTFQRGKTSWNFSNRTPSFYFDNSWINPLYDLLTQNKREWDVLLQEYSKNSDHGLVEELRNFIGDMDQALINIEKLDNALKAKKLYPELAASMRSGFPNERDEAKNNTEFSFWIYRATWAGANTTEILFGIPFFTNQQLRMEKIDGLSGEAISLGKEDDFKNLISQFNAHRKKLEKGITKIKRMIK